MGDRVQRAHLRLLRDASSLTKQSYVEFDLDDIFANQRYAEFRLFFLTIHASRITPIAPEAPVTKGSPARQRPPRAQPMRMHSIWPRTARDAGSRIPHAV